MYAVCVCVCVRAFGRSAAAAGAHYDQLRFTAASKFYHAIIKSIGHTLHHIIHTLFKMAGTPESCLFDLQSFCCVHLGNKTTIHADEPGG